MSIYTDGRIEKIMGIMDCFDSPDSVVKRRDVLVELLKRIDPDKKIQNVEWAARGTRIISRMNVNLWGYSYNQERLEQYMVCNGNHRSSLWFVKMRDCLYIEVNNHD